MFSGIGRWINDRWPLSALIRLILEEEMPGGTSFAYIFGSCVFVIFLLQVITGIWQLLYFVPTTDHAYDSLNYLRIEVPFGWLIHGLHYWGATAMVILVGLHMSQVFIWGAYKNPRQLTWLIGVVQLILTLALGFTGPILAWDQRGYWEAEVGTSMASTVPLLGNLVEMLLRGGGGLGQMALSRFFFLHVAILPGILLVLIGLHLIAFRQFGISGPWDEAKRKQTGLFWPDQVFKDMLVIITVFIILVGLSAYVRPPIFGPVDLMATTYTPKPEWYFLFLYQSLKAFHGKLEPLGTVGIPLLVILLLLSLPFIDRGAERNPVRRPVAMAGYLVFVIWVIIMVFVGYYSKLGPSAGGEGQTPSSPAVPSTRMSASAARGAQFFQSLGCIGCHRINGKGGAIGPDLSPGVLKGKSRQWLITQIRDPKKHDPHTIMPAFSSATDKQINDLVDYLSIMAAGGPPPLTTKPGQPIATPPPSAASAAPAIKTGPHGLPGLASDSIGNPDLGDVTFKNICEACHGLKGTDKVPNPGSDDGTMPPLNPIDRHLFSENAQIFADKIDRIIQHGSIPKGPNPELHMLPFGDTHALTQNQIANVEAYVMQLNGVDRTKVMNPGIPPNVFFWLFVIVFGLTGLGLVGLWIRNKPVEGTP